MQDHTPHKLSKPLTNTSSSNLSASALQSLEPISALTSLDADGTETDFGKMAANGERRKRRDTIRSYLYGPNPESGHSHSSEDEESHPWKLANVARDAKRRLSRTESSLSQNLNTGGASAASSTSRLALSTDLSEDDLIKEQIKEKVWIDTLAAQNHISPPIDEDKHPDSVKSPIRRRSLYTPGIATRSPEDILRKPPPPEHLKSQADRDYYYDPALPESSPLSRLAGLRSPHNGRSTPSELGYSHLGTLKLGTLRVTNGTVSPTPRERHDITASTLVPYATCQEDYTHCEGRRGEEDVDLTTGNLIKDTPHVLRDDLRGIAVSAAETPTNSAAQSFDFFSPRGHHDQDGSRTPSITVVKKLPTIKRKPVPEVSAAVQSQGDRARSGTFHPSGVQVNHRPLQTVAGFEDNMPTSQTSPTDRTEYSNHCAWRSPKREPESWRSFIPGANQTRANDESREDAFRKLTRNQRGQEKSDDAADTSQNPHHDFSLTKHNADSGYSSNVSLESTQKIASQPDLKTMTASQTSAHTQPLSSYLPPTPCKTKPSRYSQGSEEIREKDASISAVPSMLEKPTNSTVSDNFGRSSVAIYNKRGLAPSSQKRLSSPEKSRRLQKKRPKSQPSTQQTLKSAQTGLMDSDVSPVPASVTALQFERISKSPLVDRTYSDSPHPKTEQMPTGPTSTDDQTHFPFLTPGSEVPQLEEHPSIFQKMASKARSRSRSRYRPRKEQIADHSDNESAKSDICRSPSWSDYGNTKKKQQRKKEKAERELEKLESATGPDSRSRSRSRSRLRSRSRRRSSQCEAVPTLAVSDVVRESLGAGPYDIALAGRASNHSSAGKQLQPYQVSTIKHGMDPNDSFSLRPLESNRHRSHTLVAVPLREGLQAHENVPPEPTRPYSMYTDQGPVPAMPMADLTQKNIISRRGTDLSLARNAQMVTSIDQVPPRTLNPISGDGSEAESDWGAEPQCTSIKVPAANTSISMEALIDRLLDATSPEARESTLEQIRQKRLETLTKLCKEADRDKTMSPEMGGTLHISQKDAGLIVGRNTPLAAFTRALPPPPNLEGCRANTLEANECLRHHSMFIDAPPMPPILSTEDIQQQEARKSMERSARTKTLDRPQMQASETAKSDLWAGCAIQTEHRKAIESRASSTEWDTHRLAWSHRRKSAGEALSQTHKPSGPVSGLDDVGRERAQPLVVSHTQIEQLSMPSNTLKAFHKPWAPSQGHDPPQTHSTVPLQANYNSVVGAPMFERRSGRYEGGLLYGYEPGFGLGGSAGTRSTKTGATRKSLRFSQGFGVDLSDVPIFVAPSKKDVVNSA
ncbi:MAG: hypothetical protein Q9182_000196 [Xanthomendoza sp. 2 TL-2023]